MFAGLALSGVVGLAFSLPGLLRERLGWSLLGRRLVALAGALLVVAAVLVAAGQTDMFLGRIGLKPYDAGRWEHQSLGLAYGLTGAWNERGLLGLLAGIGPGQFETRFISAAHQTYIRVFVETGPLTLVLFLAAYVVLAWRALRRVGDPPDPLALGVLRTPSPWR